MNKKTTISSLLTSVHEPLSYAVITTPCFGCNAQQNTNNVRNVYSY